MNATFGVSACISESKFVLQVNLNRIVSANPGQYGDIVAPFTLPPIKVGGGAGTLPNYVGFLEFSIATQGVAVSPRDVLGEHPTLQLLGTGGVLQANVQFWTTNTRLGIRFDPIGTGTKEYTITAVVGTDGVVRWRNPAANVSV